MTDSTNVKVFPVVQRIRTEIDFCFSAFYGNLTGDKMICESVFDNWLKKGYRGPGQLSIYVEMLASHLHNSTQKSIFRNLSLDAITLTHKSDKPTKDTFYQRHKFTVLFNALIFVTGLLLILLFANLDLI